MSYVTDKILHDCLSPGSIYICQITEENSTRSSLDYFTVVYLSKTLSNSALAEKRLCKVVCPRKLHDSDVELADVAAPYTHAY